jgi:hypothetical protein
MRFVGQRLTFTATFLTFGKTQNKAGHPISYMLVQDVRHNGRWLADHVWIPLRKDEHVKAQLQRGDDIRFSAEVNIYTKGNLRHRRIDYGLCRPRDVERVEQMTEIDMEQGA